MQTLQSGDRVNTPSGDAATVIRPNRLDPDKLIVWPDRWGHLPTNTAAGPGMCLRADTLTVIAPAAERPQPTPVRPNPSLAAAADQTANPTQGVTR